MFNLLPEDLKKAIKKEYNLRRMIAAFAFLIFISGSFLIFLFPSWVVSFYREREITKQAEQNSHGSLTSEVDEVNSTIKKVNFELRTIDTSLEYPKIIPLINSIILKKTNLITLSEITYNLKDKENATILIEGVSATRAGLVAFVKGLEESKTFKKVNLPISNYAKDKNINFSINLTISP